MLNILIFHNLMNINKLNNIIFKLLFYFFNLFNPNKIYKIYFKHKMKEKYQHFKIQTILVLLVFFFHFISTEETNDDLMILGIEPNSGPISGETRVMARLKLLDDKKVKEFPHPRCRFGSKESEVEAVYVKCTPNPRTINEPESDFEKRTDVNLFFFNF